MALPPLAIGRTLRGLANVAPMMVTDVRVIVGEKKGTPGEEKQTSSDDAAGRR